MTKGSFRIYGHQAALKARAKLLVDQQTLHKEIEIEIEILWTNPVAKEAWQRNSPKVFRCKSFSIEIVPPGKVWGNSQYKGWSAAKYIFLAIECKCKCKFKCKFKCKCKSFSIEVVFLEKYGVIPHHEAIINLFQYKSLHLVHHVPIEILWTNSFAKVV